MVNVYTVVCKARFTRFQHLLEYLQLAKIKAWIWVVPSFSGATMKAMVRSGQAGFPIEQDKISTRPKGVQGLSSFLQQFRWWHTRRKSKAQTQLHKSVLSLATSLAFLGWYRWQQSQDSSHHCIRCIAFLQLIPCYTTGVFLKSELQELQESAFGTVVPFSQ